MAPETSNSSDRGFGDVSRNRKKSISLTAEGAAATVARASLLTRESTISFSSSLEACPEIEMGPRPSYKRSSTAPAELLDTFEIAMPDPMLRQCSDPKAHALPPLSRNPISPAAGQLPKKQIQYASAPLPLAPASSEEQTDGSIVPSILEIQRPATWAHRGSPRKLYYLERDALIYHDSLGLTPDGPGLGRSLALSVRSAPSGGSRNCPRSPDVIAKSAPEVMTKRSPRNQKGHTTPGWSFRYLESMGSITNPDEQGTGSKKAVTKTVQKSAPVDSVFLAKNGRDKRLPSKDEMMMGRVKPSRWEGRRSAISGTGPSKLQVKAAVKMHTLRHPDKMRRLHRQCEASSGKGKIQVNVKHLEPGKLDELMEQTGLPEDEVNNLYVSFTRYDIDDSGYLDRTEVRQVLCDLGLQPHGCEEKVEVHEIMCDADEEGLRHYNFEQFVAMVQAVRIRLRQIQYGECMNIFEDADKDNNEYLNMEEVFWLLDKRLQMMPRTIDERHEIVAIFQSCTGKQDGEVCFEEFQDFVQRARAKLMMMRREEELTIAKAFALSSEAVAEFRMDLPQLWNMFNRYDRRGHSTVARADLMGLFIDVGLCPFLPQSGCDKMTAVSNVADCYAKEETDFPLFLKICHELRIKGKQTVQDDLLDRFHCYDRYRLSELHYSEVYQILADLKMLPKSREEQQAIVSVMERLDTNGSGSFDFEEFQDFFQRLLEQVQMTERDEERQVILKMGYTEYQLQVLRSTFLGLGPNVHGVIAQIGLVSAVHRTRDILCPAGADEANIRDITRSAQQAPDRAITFQDFAEALKKIMAKKEDDLIGDDS